VNILVISSFLLFKETRFGGSKRLYFFIEELKKYAEIDLICIDGCKEIDRYKKECSGYNYFKIIQRKEKRDLKSRILFSDLDLRANKYDSIQEISKYLEYKSYDSVIIAFPLALALQKVISKKNKDFIYIEDDLYFEKIRQTAQNSKFLSLKYIIKYYKYFQTIHFYKKNIKRAKTYVCISEQEQLIVWKKFPTINCTILKYGIHLDDFPQIKVSKTKALGFIGNYNHTPNVDAVNYLFKSIFDKRISEYPIIIGGQNLPDEFTKKYSINNVTFLSDLQNISTFYENIFIFINPIISGRGLRTKLIEAAAFGRPIVSTPLGGEGLDDLEILYFGNSKEFYDNIDLLYHDFKKYSEIVEKNRNVICTNYDITKIILDLTTILGV
jgi:glycosyltransferase involved in cell wall biosynthesis